MIMMNKKIDKEDIIELHDEQTLSDLMEQKKGVDNGRRLKATTVDTYNVTEDSKIVIQEVNTTPGSTKILVVEIPDEEIQEYFIGETPTWFAPATMQKVLEREDFFVFEEPDTNDFDIEELTPASSFMLDDKDLYEQTNEFVFESRSTVMSITIWKHKEEDKYIFMIWAGIGESSSIELFEGRVIEPQDVKVL